MAKKVKNLSATVTSSYSPVLTATVNSASIAVSWNFGTPPSSKIVKFSMLNRRYTSPNGNVITYLGSDWVIIKTNYQESWYLAGQSYVTSHTETTTTPFDTDDLITGTYEYQLRGTIGTLGNSLTDVPFISNVVTVVVS